MRDIVVEVTEYDISYAVGAVHVLHYERKANCMIARAMSRELGFPVKCGSFYAYPTGAARYDSEGRHQNGWLLPAEARAEIVKFDLKQYADLKPFTFTATWEVKHV